MAFRFSQSVVLDNILIKSHPYGDSVFSPRTKMTIDKMSETLGVSYSSLLIRLRSLKMFERHDISEYVTRVLKIKSDVE